MRGTIVNVDQARKLIRIEVNGLKVDYNVDDHTQFIDPHEGVVRLGIKDERVVKGTVVFIGSNGSVLTEVHLPSRDQIGK